MANKSNNMEISVIHGREGIYVFLDENVRQAIKLLELVKKEKKNPYNQATIMHIDVKEHQKYKLTDYLQSLLDRSKQQNSASEKPLESNEN